jgi:hypothetical protein
MSQFKEQVRSLEYELHQEREKNAELNMRNSAPVFSNSY